MSKQRTEKKVVTKKSNAPAPNRKANLYIGLSIILITLLLYGRTYNYEFTLDDRLFVANNKTVAKGLKAIPQIFSENSLYGYFGSKNVDEIYRPVTLSSFAVQIDLLDGGPEVSHTINILLYILSGLLLFSFLKIFLEKWPVWICGAIAILFIIHPIHTEVACSVKSRDEILACIFSLLALRSLLKNNKPLFTLRQLIAPFWMTLALFSKESSITMILLIPFLLYFKGENSFKKIAMKTVPFVVAALFLLLARHLVLTDQTELRSQVIYNSLNATQGFSQLYGTRFYILLLFLKMVFIPYPLTWDYSFRHIPFYEILDFYPILSILIHGALIGIMIYFFKKRDLVGFGILFFFITASVTNNFFIRIGNTFAERSLFIPTIGFLLAMTGIVVHLFKLNHSEIIKSKIVKVLFLVVCIVYCSISYSRIPDWKNELELYLSGVETAPNSFRTQFGLGTVYMNKPKVPDTSSTVGIDYWKEAKSLFKRSIEILPSNFEAHYNLGFMASSERDTVSAKNWYKECLQYAPHHKNSNRDLALIYINSIEYDSALFFLDKIIPEGTDYQVVCESYFYIYFKKGDFNTALSYAEKGIKMAPDKPGSYLDKGSALFVLGDTAGFLSYVDRYRKLGGK